MVAALFGIGGELALNKSLLPLDLWSDLAASWSVTFGHLK